MRIWSIHPKYLDTKGLVALWRETLLAKNVLEGRTKGYKNHPQLTRFKKSDKPLQAIHHYLSVVYQESLNRGYHFNKEKFTSHNEPITITVTSGQMDYERQHLLKKLKVRDVDRYDALLNATNTELHPLFQIIEGGIEDWEMIT